MESLPPSSRAHQTQGAPRPGLAGWGGGLGDLLDAPRPAKGSKTQLE